MLGARIDADCHCRRARDEAMPSETKLSIDLVISYNASIYDYIDYTCVYKCAYVIKVYIWIYIYSMCTYCGICTVSKGAFDS